MKITIDSATLMNKGLEVTSSLVVDIPKTRSRCIFIPKA
jgi:1-deoxy-D-xylulose 5-phosphate reductoisomerase